MSQPLVENPFGTLAAPTPEQLAAKVMPLQYGWAFAGFGREPGEPTQQWSPSYPTVADLLTFMAEHGIPQAARVQYAECGSHMIELDWTEQAS